VTPSPPVRASEHSRASGRVDGANQDAALRVADFNMSSVSPPTEREKLSSPTRAARQRPGFPADLARMGRSRRGNLIAKYGAAPTICGAITLRGGNRGGGWRQDPEVTLRRMTRTDQSRCRVPRCLEAARWCSSLFPAPSRPRARTTTCLASSSGPRLQSQGCLDHRVCCCQRRLRDGCLGCGAKRRRRRGHARDGSGEFAKAMGLEFDLSAGVSVSDQAVRGVLEDGVITYLG